MILPLGTDIPLSSITDRGLLFMSGRCEPCVDVMLSTKISDNQPKHFRAGSKRRIIIAEL